MGLVNAQAAHGFLERPYRLGTVGSTEPTAALDAEAALAADEVTATEAGPTGCAASTLSDD